MTKRLRIAVLSRNFATTGGGAERYSIAVVEQLAPRHDIHVFAQNIEHVFPGVTYHQVPMPMRRPRWINQLYFAFATWRATRHGFDIVHSHENTWHGNVQTVHVLPIKHTLFDGKQGLPLALRWLKVMTSPRLLAYLWLEKQRYSLHGKRRIVLTSNSLRDVMLQAYPEAKTAMDVITPGVAAVQGLCTPDEQRAARTVLGLPLDGTCLLFVGNDFRKKGLPTLIQSLHLLPTDTYLAVVGASSQLAETRQAVVATGLGHRVWFLGALVDMADAYRSADCLVHPTLEDTYAMVVLEAMSHGLPVVVSGPAHCGISGDLEHGVHALLLKDPGSVTDLGCTVASILNAPDVARRLSYMAIKFAQHHSWGQVARKYEQGFDDVVAKPVQRWLVLAHAFNMDGRAASQTITDKLPHLEKSGIELVVLSGVSGKHDTHFEHHQLWPAGPAGIRFELRHVLRKRLGYRVNYRVIMTLASLILLPGMVVEKLLWQVESSWSWWLSAYCKGRWLARHRPFDLVYSTGGAFAAHVAARHLKKALKVPWMAEVHDPLINPAHLPGVPMSGQQKMQADIERYICTDADVAIWFTDQALASARKRNPQLAERGKVMLPGIDRPFEKMPPHRQGAKFVIGHFGSLSITRHLGPILAALELLNERSNDLVNIVELHVYGGPLDAISTEKLARSTVKNRVHHFGRIEADPQTGVSGREQILQRMHAMDVLLLLHGEEPICSEYIPSKMYEYLWMQRPILALVHRNPQMARMLSQLGHTAVLSDSGESGAAEVHQQLAAAIEVLYGRWLGAALEDNGQDSPYTTEAAVTQLVAWTSQ